MVKKSEIAKDLELKKGDLKKLKDNLKQVYDLHTVAMGGIHGATIGGIHGLVGGAIAGGAISIVADSAIEVIEDVLKIESVPEKEIKEIEKEIKKEEAKEETLAKPKKSRAKKTKKDVVVDDDSCTIS
jgi:hypothetical protein